MITTFAKSTSPSFFQSIPGIVNRPSFSPESYTLSLNPTQDKNEAPDVAAEIAPILMEICAATDWDYGEVWVPSADSAVLELSSIAHIAPETADLLSLEQFQLCSEGLVVSPAEGLPGRVWSSGQSEYVADATAESESYWSRNQLATAFNVSTGFATPVIVNGQLQAVMVFFKLGNN
jgi:hypothetical protein